MVASRAQSCAEAQTFAWGVRALPAAEERTSLVGGASATQDSIAPM